MYYRALGAHARFMKPYRELAPRGSRGGRVAACQHKLRAILQKQRRRRYSRERERETSRRQLTVRPCIVQSVEVKL